MKKLLFLLAFPALSFGQWTENFDAGTTLPAGWAVVDVDGGNSWEISEPSTGSAQSGDYVASILYNSNAHNDYLITKAIVVQVGVSDRISFYVKSDDDFYLEDYEVLLSTTNQAAAAFTTVLQAAEKAPETWTKKTFSLSAYAGQTVYVAIHATDADQLYLYADTFVVDTTPTAIPLCTSFTSPTNGATGVNSDGVLTWNSASGAAGYKLKVGTTSGGTDVVNNEDLGDVINYNIPGTLNMNTTYYATITPYNNLGDAVGCSQISFTTMSPPTNDECSGAITLTAGGSFVQNAITGNTIGASDASGLGASCLFNSSNAENNVWFKVVVPASGNLTIETDAAPGSGLDDTVLSVFTDCSSTTSIACNDDGGTDAFSKIELTGQTPGTTLYVSVWKYTSSDDGEFKISAYDTSLLATSEASASNKNNIKVHPNPFAENLNISDISKVKSVSVVDVSGRLVKTFDKPSSSLSLGDLKQGMYLISLELKDGSRQVVKVIKK
ncbi:MULTISPECIES: choice-of-anchor J domain-containing protein [unclassified Chryseobacterium]|uniref:T9SS-dependent choice-of-anchor J family protein n=1 Tax=unclassified Chryseobacterium TaxID=2593645 RepID=UPI002269B6C0|nr:MULTISPECIES: choice-of-anchor J domain-containing protein [unclassified Chryseobacterium]